MGKLGGKGGAKKRSTGGMGGGGGKKGKLVCLSQNNRGKRTRPKGQGEGRETKILELYQGRKKA